MKTNGKEIIKLVIDYLLMTIGVFFYAFAWNAFVVPSGLSGGGLAGTCTILNYATGVPIYVYFAIINIALLVIGTIVMGKAFGFKTIWCVIISTLFFAVLPDMEWVGRIGLHTLPEGTDKALMALVNAIIGGFICAVGIALVFMRQGSTGGTDIVALIINKFYDISPGKIFMYCDFVIVGSIILLPGKNLSDVIFGYLFTIAFSYMLDMILTGEKQSVQVLIFSTKYQEIGDMLIHEHNRGVTALNSVGWYSQQDSKVLVVVTRRNQLNEIVRSVKEADDKAFITVCSVSSVYGMGFEQVKMGMGKKGVKKESKLKQVKRWLNS